jgi:adenylylsulfate kinase-like enzyme
VQCNSKVREASELEGLHAKTHLGGLRDFTGASAPNEPPTRLEPEVDTEHTDPSVRVAQLVGHVEGKVRLDPVPPNA